MRRMAQQGVIVKIGWCLCLFTWSLIAQETIFYFPHFTEKVNEWETMISLVNAGGRSMEVELEAFDSDGVLAASSTILLTAASAQRGRISEWFPDIAADRGWIRLVSDSAELTGMLVFTHLSAGGTSSLPLFTTAQTSWMCAELKHTENETSGFVITNVSESQQRVKVNFNQDDGQRFSTDLDLGPRSKWVGLLSDLFAVSNSTGYLTIEGQADVVPLALTFVNGLQQIVAVPAVERTNDGVASLQDTLEESYSHYQRAGAQLGVRAHGGTSVTAASGLSDIEAQIPLTTKYPVEIGSITKSFISAAMLLLQEQGSLDLDHFLSQYRPGFPNGDQITLRMLLNHTSGVPDYDTVDEFLQGVIDSLTSGQPKTYTPEDLIQFALKDPFQFDPGSDWGYANTNYILAGMILEEVSGQTLESLLRELIIEPLDLRHTYLGDKETPPWLCQQYLRDEPGQNLINTTQATNLSWAWAAGAMLSTPEDLIKWSDALFRTDFLSQDSRAQLMSQDDFGNRYGLGVYRFSLLGKWVWGHDGATFGGLAFFGAYENSNRSLGTVITYRESQSPLIDILIAGVDWLDQNNGVTKGSDIHLPNYEQDFLNLVQAGLAKRHQQIK